MPTKMEWRLYEFEFPLKERYRRGGEWAKTVKGARTRLCRRYKIDALPPDARVWPVADCTRQAVLAANKLIPVHPDKEFRPVD